MGQGDVYEILQDSPGKYFTAHQIADILGLSYTAVSVALKKIHDRGEIERTERPKMPIPYYYKYKEKKEE